MKNIKKGLGEKIRNARERVGMSQKSLAEKMGFPAHQIISQIETGVRDIKAWELSKLTGILNVDLTELLTFEKHERKGVVLWREEPEHDKEEKETYFQKKCQEYDQLEKAASIKKYENLPTFKIDVNTINYNTVNELAVKVSKELNLGQKPALALEKVLEDQYGVKIWYEDLGEKGSAASTWDTFGPAILMNINHAPWRRNYSFAHELFHLITWKSVPPERLRDDAGLFRQFEKYADAFASSVLLPTDSVINEFNKYVVNNTISDVNLVSIARDFGVSTSALLFRMCNLNRIEKKEIDRILDDEDFRNIDRRTMHENWWEPPPMPERFVKLGFIAYRNGNVSRARLAEYFNTSLFELKNMFLEYGFDEDYETQIRTL